MKRWRCNACLKRGLPIEECEWDDHLTQSHCRACGEAAVRIVEFGCFQCHEEGVTFYAEQASSQPCPACGADAFRIVYAPAVLRPDRHASFAAADRMLEKELDRQKVSTTSLKREAPVRDRNPLPEGDPRRGGWADASTLLPSAGKGIGGRLPFGMPRPVTEIVARHDANI